MTGWKLVRDILLKFINSKSIPHHIRQYKCILPHAQVPKPFSNKNNHEESPDAQLKQFLSCDNSKQMMQS